MSREKSDNKFNDLRFLEELEKDHDNQEFNLEEASKIARNISRPFSAPPPGLYDEENQLEKDDIRYDPKYAYYYYSHKPLDPRLPKPLYKLPYGISLAEFIDPKNLERIFNAPNSFLSGGKGEDKNTFQQTMEERINNLSKGLGQIDLQENKVQPQLQIPKQDQSRQFISQAFVGQQYDESGFLQGPTPTQGIYGYGQQTQNKQPYQMDTQQFYPNQQNIMFQGQQKPPQQRNAPQKNQVINQQQPQMNQFMKPKMQQQQQQQQQYYGQVPRYPQQQQQQQQPQQARYGGYYDQEQEYMGYGNDIMGTRMGGQGMGAPMGGIGVGMMPNIGGMGPGMMQGIGQDISGYNMNPYYMQTDYGQQYYPQQQYPSNRMMNQRMNQGMPEYYGIQGVAGAGVYNPMHKKMDLKTLMTNLLENCKDQNGSRTIQQEFERASDADKEMIFNALKEHIDDLINDVFGNYVIQKILENGTPTQRSQIFEKMRGKINKLSINTYGCRVVQKALEVFKNESDKQLLIVDELKPDILNIIQDQNGNHVIQKCVESVNPRYLDFILTEADSRLDELSFHAYGCRVIQRILEHIPSDKIINILNKLLVNSKKLCECQFGNYLMQHIVEKGPIEQKNILLQVIYKHFTELSLNKFASNVTEKAVIFSSPEYRYQLVNLLLSTFHNNEIALICLMKDQFGNYVAQRLIEYCDVNTRRIIQQKIQSEINELKKTQYGKHVVAYLEKSFEPQQRQQYMQQYQGGTY